MIEPQFEIQRPFVVKSGFPASFIESNCTNAYVGEWIVFQLAINDYDYAELRVPFEAGLEAGLLKVTNGDAYVEHD